MSGIHPNWTSAAFWARVARLQVQRGAAVAALRAKKRREG